MKKTDLTTIKTSTKHRNNHGFKLKFPDFRPKFQGFYIKFIVETSKSILNLKNKPPTDKGKVANTGNTEIN